MARLFEGFTALVATLEFAPFAPMRRGPEPSITLEHLEEVRARMGETHAGEVYEDYMRQWKEWHSAKPFRAGMVLKMRDGDCVLVGHYNEFLAMLGDGGENLEDEVESVAFLY